MHSFLSIFCRWLVVWLLFVGFARAHDAFTTSASVVLRANEVVIRVTANPEVALALARGDTKKARRLKREDFAARREELLELAPRLFLLETAKRDALVPAEPSVAFTADDDVEWKLTYPLPAGSGGIDVRAAYLLQLPEGHVAAVVVHDEVSGYISTPQLLNRENSALLVRVDAPEGNTVPVVNIGGTERTEQEAGEKGKETSEGRPVGRETQSESGGHVFMSYLRLGVVHILAGYDHLLFLFVLLIVARRIRSVVGIVTCFTLAHSITLTLAVLGLVTISPKVIEPLIAASIVYVALENIFRPEAPRYRSVVTFLFGLVHGFGFAGALKEAGLGVEGPIALPLFSFNLGVELGQLFVIGLLFPVLLVLHRRSQLDARAIRIVSVAVAVTGGIWIVDRVTGG